MKAYRIAVVDDQQSDRDWLAEKLTAYMSRERLAYTLSAFDSGEAFLSGLKSGRFDIVFMDVYMDGVSGIHAAQKLREHDKDCKLVFFTCSEDFMRQGFSLNSAHYLVKPVKNEDFEQAMENCRLQRRFQVPTLEVTIGGHTLEVDTAEIQFLEVEQRNTLLHTTAGPLSLGRSFSSLAELLLADRRFLLCYKGLLVNMDHIIAQEGEDFLLDSGARLPIAPRRKRTILAQYRDYVFGCMGGII